MRCLGYIISMLISIIIAGIIGVIVGNIVFTTEIPGLINSIAITSAIGVIGLAGVIFLAVFEKCKNCICKNGIWIAISGVGLIITTLITIAISPIIDTGIIEIAVLIGIVAFLLMLGLLETLKLTLCLIWNKCYCRNL